MAAAGPSRGVDRAAAGVPRAPGRRGVLGYVRGSRNPNDPACRPPVVASRFVWRYGGCGLRRAKPGRAAGLAPRASSLSLVPSSCSWFPLLVVAPTPTGPGGTARLSCIELGVRAAPRLGPRRHRRPERSRNSSGAACCRVVSPPPDLWRALPQRHHELLVFAARSAHLPVETSRGHGWPGQASCRGRPRRLSVPVFSHWRSSGPLQLCGLMSSPGQQGPWRTLVLTSCPFTVVRSHCVLEGR